MQIADAAGPRQAQADQYFAGAGQRCGKFSQNHLLIIANVEGMHILMIQSLVVSF